jgi:uncharacterized Tic20 family protein
MRTRQEQLISALCHLFNAVPLWGLLFCGWVWFAMREESRGVVRQAQQAMTFHALLMGGLFIWMILEWFARIISVLSPTLSGILSETNSVILALLLLVYVSICLIGFARCLSGQPFQYPLLSRRT